MCKGKWSYKNGTVNLFGNKEGDRRELIMQFRILYTCLTPNPRGKKNTLSTQPESRQVCALFIGTYFQYRKINYKFRS